MALVARFDGEAKVGLDRSALAAPVTGKIFEGRIGRTHGPGDPLVYGPNDHEYRDAGELAKLVDQCIGKPVTLLHPRGLIRDGAEAVVVGSIVRAWVDDDTLVAQMFITDPRGLEAIEDGVVELSMGYSAALDDTLYQRDITLDHVAIVPAARCGDTCALRADGARQDIHMKVDPVADCGCKQTQSGTELPAVTCQCKNHAVYSDTMTLDELQKALDEAKAALDAMTKRATDAEAALDALKSDLSANPKRTADLSANPKRSLDDVDQQVALDNAKKDLELAQKALDAANARADQAETAAKVVAAKAKLDAAAEHQAKLDAEVTTRVKVLTDANTVLGAKDDSGNPIDRSKLSNREIKIEIIKHVDGDEIPEGAEDAYVDGMYAGALRRHAKAADSKAAVRETIATTRSDAANQIPSSGLAAEKAALDEYKRRSSTAWAATENK